MNTLHYVGLDVHAGSIAVAVAGEGGVRDLGTFEHDVARVMKVISKVGRPESVRVAYEAGPTGFGLCRALRAAGYSCEVIAPSLVPKRPGDRVKTDRRDARGLADLLRAGLLTPVVVPSLEQEALRDLVRARESAKEWEKKSRQQLDKFLLRHGRRPKEKMTKWTQKHMRWVCSQVFAEPAQQVTFEEYLSEISHQEERVKRLDAALEAAAARLPMATQRVVHALMALKGVRFLGAITLVAELGDIMRFSHPTQLMSYAGVVPREHSSGDAVRRGAITKSGNAHVRRIIGEAAWAYARGQPAASRVVKQRRQGLGAELVNIAEKADRRLRQRFVRLHSRSKPINVVVTAVARELLGFVWAMGVQAQRAPAAAR